MNSDSPTDHQGQPAITVKPDGAKLFMGWYDRPSDTNNSLIDVYGRWGTIASNGDVSFYTNDFRITTTNFPPVFVGTALRKLVAGKKVGDLWRGLCYQVGRCWATFARQSNFYRQDQEPSGSDQQRPFS